MYPSNTRHIQYCVLVVELVAGARDRAFGNGGRVLKEARRQARFFFLRVEFFFFNVFFLVLFKI